MTHPVDVHVEKRIRHRRWMVGMTQQKLAEQVGIKFQQIQKYVAGVNRVLASRLWDAAEAMTVQVGYFLKAWGTTTWHALTRQHMDAFAGRSAWRHPSGGVGPHLLRDPGKPTQALV